MGASDPFAAVLGGARGSTRPEALDERMVRLLAAPTRERQELADTTCQFLCERGYEPARDPGWWLYKDGVICTSHLLEDVAGYPLSEEQIQALETLPGNSQ